MTETPEQRKERLALQAIDGAKAAIEYREKRDAVLRRTAQLRAERLAREDAQRGAAKAKSKGSRQPVTAPAASGYQAADRS
jgi:hypothetical protein